MTALILITLGTLALAFVAVDAAWTTLWPDRSGGPASSRLMAWAWRVASPRLASHHLLLSLLGPAAIALVLAFWVALLWLGWFFIFAADPVSVVNTHSREPASAFDSLYFAGYTVFTLGNGDYSPNGFAAQLLTVLASGSGLILVSLAITYLISVLGAVVNKRTFASRVHAVGRTPSEFVANTWDDGFAGIDLLLSSLAADLSRLGAQHLAYPVIHFYHPTQRTGSTAVAVAVLDEAASLLEAGVPAGIRPSRAILRSVQGAVEAYLSTLAGGTVSWAATAPPAVDLTGIRSAGVPTVDEEDYLAGIEAKGERRRKLLGLVQSDQWEWPGRH